MLSTATSISNSEKTGIPSKRIDVIDALRGFSLLGIILTHTTYSFLETTAQPLSISDTANLTLVGTAIKMGVQVLTTGKFYSIFSFLFGLSFFIQLQSAKQKGVPFTSRFLWRLFILLIMGYLHTMLYPRDVLQIYALLGAVLLFCINWSGKKLLWGSVVLFVASVLATVFSPQLEAIIFPYITEANQYAASEVFGVGKFAFLIPSGRVFVIVGLFMLGLYAGRKRIFQDTPQNNQLFRMMLIWCGIISFVSTGAVGMVAFTNLAANPVADVAMTILTAVQKIALSAFFVAAVVRLFKDNNILSKILHWLVPVGRVGLTTYIVQSFFLVGFYEQAMAPETLLSLGLVFVVAVTIFFFVGQMLFSSWWLARFRLGPFEWLWRSLTYLKVQPIRKSEANTTSEKTGFAETEVMPRVAEGL